MSSVRSVNSSVACVMSVTSVKSDVSSSVSYWFHQIEPQIRTKTRANAIKMRAMRAVSPWLPVLKLPVLRCPPKNNGWTTAIYNPKMTKSHANLNIKPDVSTIKLLRNGPSMNLTLRNKPAVNNKKNVMNAKYLAQTNEWHNPRNNCVCLTTYVGRVRMIQTTSLLTNQGLVPTKKMARVALQ